jgi:hypothetical protein
MPRNSIPSTVVGLLVLVAGWAVYHYELVSEVAAGRLLLLALLAAVCGGSIWPRLVRAHDPRARAMLVLLGVAWCFGVGYEPLRVAFPTAAVGEAQLPTPEGEFDTTIAAPDGACELLVSGRLADDAQTHAVYQLDVGGENTPVSGRFERVFYRAKGRRRIVRGVQTVERTENLHRLERRCQTSLAVGLRKLPEALDGPLTIEVHRARLRPELPLACAILALVAAVFIDRRTESEGIPLAYAVAVTLVFSLDFPVEATPHRMVGPALGASLLAMILGIPAAWMLSRLLAGSASHGR